MRQKIKQQEVIIKKLKAVIKLKDNVYQELDLIPEKRRIKDLNTKKKVINFLNDLPKELSLKHAIKSIGFSETRYKRWKKEIKEDKNCLHNNEYVQI